MKINSSVFSSSFSLFWKRIKWGVGAKQDFEEEELRRKLSLEGNEAVLLSRHSASGPNEYQEPNKLLKYGLHLIKTKKMDTYMTSLVYSALGSIANVVKKDKKLAFAYFEEGAELGCPFCMKTVADYLICEDSPVERDEARGFRLLSQCLEMKYYHASWSFMNFPVEKRPPNWSEVYEEGMALGNGTLASELYNCFAFIQKDTIKADKMLEAAFNAGFYYAVLKTVRERFKRPGSYEKGMYWLEKLAERVEQGKVYGTMGSFCTQMGGKHAQNSTKYFKKAYKLKFPESYPILAIRVGFTDPNPDESASLDIVEEGIRDMADICSFYFISGFMENSNNPQKHKKRIAKLMEHAHKLICFSASSKLGRMYLEGEDVEQNYKKAYEYLKVGYFAGDEEDSLLIAQLYLEGKGVKKNEKKAKQILEYLAKKGSKKASENLKKLI